MKGIPSPLMGEGEALHHVGCRTKALNLMWFRGGGDLGDYFTASGGKGGFLIFVTILHNFIRKGI
jgi:hypothetical protein